MPYSYTKKHNTKCHLCHSSIYVIVSRWLDDSMMATILCHSGIIVFVCTQINWKKKPYQTFSIVFKINSTLIQFYLVWFRRSTTFDCQLESNESKVYILHMKMLLLSIFSIFAWSKLSRLKERIQEKKETAIVVININASTASANAYNIIYLFAFESQIARKRTRT